MSNTKTALIVIDIQNDYFAGGNYPLENAEGALANALTAMTHAKDQGMPIILVQHIANPANGVSPFFNENTEGVQIHPKVRAAAPDAPVIVKRFADAFHQTTLDDTLQQLGVTKLLVCGMMTQNCVTHTAISKTAEKYQVEIIGDACATVTNLLHAIALGAVKTRMTVLNTAEAFA
ncbi:cysteine hydrolase family protein [Leeia oryzae]|uniref:cysteine hydrolase family protein n=1 Tax=Leeia oryzae TaxID=356662 RepID=UPI00037E2D7B|nr:cysteine hydrolase family protein [Leeia oryzae]